MYEYRCKIIKVIDGDTVDVDIDLGFGVWLRDERVRMAGIDTPESRTRDKEEKVYGLLSKSVVEKHLPKSSMQILKTTSDKDGQDMKGKFGRILGDFLIEDEKSLCQYMVESSYAVKYHGQAKEDVQLEHLKNRQLLLHEGVVSLKDFE